MKRLKLKTVIMTVILSTQFTSIAFANITTYSQKENTTILIDGLTYTEIEKATNKGFLDIYILEYDTTNETVGIDILRNPTEWAKRTKLTNMMTDKSVLAGVNASFFDTSATYSDILGLEYVDGKLVYAKNEYNRSVANTNSLNMKKDGTVEFGYISNVIKFATEQGVTVYVNSVNGVQDFANPTIFTGNVITDTSRYDEKHDLYKVVIEKGRVTKIVPPKTSVVLSESEIALVTKEDYIIEAMPVGTGIIYNVETNLGDRIKEYELILSGGGTLIKDGQFVSDGIQVSGNSKAPRTAVGTTADGKVITIVVDGRGASAGVTYSELAYILMERGVTNAINLDGGGSSEIATINHNDVVVMQNVPSDGTERNISNGLGYVSNIMSTERRLTRIELVPRQANLFVGNSTTILLKGYDQYNRPFYVNDQGGEYIVEGITGEFNTNTFKALTGGIGEIKVTYQGLQASGFVNVVDVAKDITLTPSSSKINAYGNTKISSTITSFENNTMPFDINLANVVVLNSNMGYVSDGVFYSTGTTGIANILVEYAGIKKTAIIEVVNEEVKAVDGIFADNYSKVDNKYIAIENTVGLPEITMFGRLEIEGNANADSATIDINNMSKNSVLRIFSGGISTPKGMAISKSNLYKNKFDVNDYLELNTKVINLETFTSDSYNLNQLNNIKMALESNTMKNIIIQNSDPTFNYLGTSKFNTLLRETINEYAKNNELNIYVVNGNTSKKNVNVDNIDSVTYIQIPKQTLLENNFKSLNNEVYFYLDNGMLKYSFKN